MIRTTGVYYDQIRDERENNTVLMMCTYIGTKDDPQAYIFICAIFSLSVQQWLYSSGSSYSYR